MGADPPPPPPPPLRSGTTTSTEEPDWTVAWNFFFFNFDRPLATIFVAGISIVHSLFHVPHLLLYRRLGILTAFWSVVGVGLLFGAVLEKEILYDIWIWYSCVYVPVMLIIMCVVLTASVWALDLKPLRAVFATIAVIFYLFMFYCIVFVQTEKRKIFTTETPTTTTTTPCPWCPTCTTPECTTTTTTTTPSTTTAAAAALRANAGGGGGGGGAMKVLGDRF